MPQRYFMHLAYRGQNYHGWQAQPNATTVQGCIEDALAKFLRRPTPIVGAGRTDTGVNARMMLAHVDLEPSAGMEQRLTAALNSMLGPDIAVYGLTPVHPTAHARFDATSRTYRYLAHTRKSPFCHTLSWQAPAHLDFDAMNTAAAMLLGTHDFTSFSKLHTDVKTNICTVTHARWHRLGPDSWHFEITADRFLRNMVRAVVGTLVDVGRGKHAPQHLLHTLKARSRAAAGTSMPGHALFLWDIKYPYLTLPETAPTLISTAL